MSLEMLGRTLIVLAVILLIAGVLMVLLGKAGLSRLPGDILYRRGNVSIFFPIVTGLAISLLLTVLINIIIWFWRR